MWPQRAFAEIWDLMVLALLLPIVLLMGLALPADWAHHNGHSQPDTATITTVDPFRGGSIIAADVRSASGQLLASDHEVNGDSPDQLGVAFDVPYAAPDGIGTTQVYAAGHDPFRTNATIFALVLTAWLAPLLMALPLVAPPDGARPRSWPSRLPWCRPRG